jgi:hypothetical protein
MPQNPHKRSKAIERNKRKRDAKKKEMRSAFDGITSKLPLVRCLISPKWETERTAEICIARRSPNRTIAFGVFTIELDGDGLIDVKGQREYTEFKFTQEFLARWKDNHGEVTDCDESLARKLIWFAAEKADAAVKDDKKAEKAMPELWGRWQKIVTALEDGESGKEYFDKAPAEEAAAAKPAPKPSPKPTPKA